MKNVLVRFAEIVFAYVVISVIAGFGAMYYAFNFVPRMVDSTFEMSHFVFASLVTFYLCIALALPFAIIVSLAEWKSIRSAFFYCAIAALAGGILGLLAYEPGQHVYVAGAILGILAGAVYWLLAGRNAGKRLAMGSSAERGVLFASLVAAALVADAAFLAWRL